MIQNKKIAEWARSMSQLMSQPVVTQDEITMVLEAHGLPLPNELKEHWTEKYD